MSYIRTFTGILINPLALKPSDIDIRDIAHALSNQCRFAGHTRQFYSVAQHSVLVSRELPVDTQLWGLLHDASEAYLTDIPRPLKHSPVFSAYRDAECRAMRVIAEAFRLPAEQPAGVHVVDNIMLRTEQGQLCPDPEAGRFTVYEFTIVPWTPVTAEAAFLQQYEIVRHYAKVVA